mmetsp:Transcript_19175/g.38173  ORF Transcript_19175/g.38173 Transcript_19175/m.38173 type:complete len:477 (-) Transcript_19175:938-2368(-)
MNRPVSLYTILRSRILIFEIDSLDDIHDIQHKHGGTEGLRHPPAAQHNDGHHRNKHPQQNKNIQKHRIRRHRHASFVVWIEAVREPGQRQAHRDIKDVAPDGAGDGHVSVALLGDHHGAQQVGHGGARREEGQAHDDGGDFEGVPDRLCPEDHKVGHDADPGDGHQKGQVAPFALARAAHVRDGEGERRHDGQQQKPGDVAQAGRILRRTDAVPEANVGLGRRLPLLHLGGPEERLGVPFFELAVVDGLGVLSAAAFVAEGGVRDARLDLLDGVPELLGGGVVVEFGEEEADLGDFDGAVFVDVHRVEDVFNFALHALFRFEVPRGEFAAAHLVVSVGVELLHGLLDLFVGHFAAQQAKHFVEFCHVDMSVVVLVELPEDFVDVAADLRDDADPGGVLGVAGLAEVVDDAHPEHGGVEEGHVVLEGGVVLGDLLLQDVPHDEFVEAHVEVHHHDIPQIQPEQHARLPQLNQLVLEK